MGQGRFPAFLPGRVTREESPGGGTRGRCPFSRGETRRPGPPCRGQDVRNEESPCQARVADHAGPIHPRPPSSSLSRAEGVGRARRSPVSAPPRANFPRRPPSAPEVGFGLLSGCRPPRARAGRTGRPRFPRRGASRARSRRPASRPFARAWPTQNAPRSPATVEPGGRLLKGGSFVLSTPAADQGWSGDSEDRPWPSLGRLAPALPTDRRAPRWPGG